MPPDTSEAMDEQQLNGLLVARGLLEKASATRDDTAPGEITAIILADAAVETAAKAILHGNVKKDRGLVPLIDALNEEWRKAAKKPEGAELDGTGQVKKLRSYRNGVQHDGNIPSAENTSRYLVYAASFVDTATEALIGRPLSELSRAQLLADGPVRDAVEEAEKLAFAGDHNPAGERLTVAFEHVLDAARGDRPWRQRLKLSRQDVRKALSGFHAGSGGGSSLKSKLKDVLDASPMKRSLSSTDRNKLADAMLDGPAIDPSGLEKLFEGIAKEFEWLSEHVEGGAAAGDPAEQAWFRARLGKGWAEWAEQLRYHTVPPEPPITYDEYIRALDFVLRAAVRQQRTSKAPAPAWSRRDIEEQRQSSDDEAE